MSRIAHRTAARAALLALVAWLVSACGQTRDGLVSPVGVVWERVTAQGLGEADRPDWSADSIAFQVQVSGLDRIAVASEDGSGVAIEPEIGSTASRSPRWVRDGLLINSSDFGGSEDLWYREVVTGVTRRLTAFPGMESSPAPRPGSPGVVYVEGANADSGRLVLIPDTAETPLRTIYLTPAGLAAGEPDWNPAGNRISFSAAGPNGTRQIWTLSLVDTLPVQITVPRPVNPATGPVLDRSPRWSPDGSRILIASNRGGRWGIWTVDPRGEAQGLFVLAQDLPGSEIRHPTWSPDGSAILLSSNRSGDRALWRVTGF